MSGIVCLGDATDRGGKVITASSTMYFDGKQAALVGDLINCPLDGHGINPIIEGDNTVQEKWPRCSGALLSLPVWMSSIEFNASSPG